jgi:hypothetical protein
MRTNWEKIRALERLADDPGATTEEAQTARRIARKLRKKHFGDMPPPAAPAPQRSSAKTAAASDGEGKPPTHGPRCNNSGHGCPDCLRIVAWRNARGWAIK